MQACRQHWALRPSACAAPASTPPQDRGRQGAGRLLPTEALPGSRAPSSARMVDALSGAGPLRTRCMLPENPSFMVHAPASSLLPERRPLTGAAPGPHQPECRPGQPRVRTCWRSRGPISQPGPFGSLTHNPLQPVLHLLVASWTNTGPRSPGPAPARVCSPQSPSCSNRGPRTGSKGGRQARWRSAQRGAVKAEP